jgi:hypothetical protein
MTYNPYAAPQGGDPHHARQPEEPSIEPLVRQPWATGEVLTAAWEAFKNNWAVLTISFVVGGVVVSIPYMGVVVYSAMNQLKSNAVVNANSVEMQSIQFVATVYGTLVYPYFLVGLNRIALFIARGGTPEIGLLFGGADRYLPMLGVFAIFHAPTLLGSLLVVGATASGNGTLVVVANLIKWIPFGILSVLQQLGLSYAQFFVADGQVGPIDAIANAWRVTGLERGKIFMFALAVGGVLACAAMCCCLPIFAAGPAMVVASAIVFTRMTGTMRTPSSA